MAIDSKFYQVTNPLSSTEVVQFADVVAFNDVTAAITHAAMPQDASKGAVIFIGDKKYLDTIAQAEGVTIITTIYRAMPLCAILMRRNTACALLSFWHLYPKTRGKTSRNRRYIADAIMARCLDWRLCCH